MKVHVQIGEVRRSASLPHEGANHVRVDGPCPACGAEDAGAFACLGQKSEQVIGHDTIEAPALALCCGATVGRLVVKLGTLFGVEEDRAVLHGRARVY
jgi:hypothetical protein